MVTNSTQADSEARLSKHKSSCRDEGGNVITTKLTYPEWHDVAAGAAAGAGARLLTAPLDLIKIRRQVLSSTNMNTRPPSMIETARAVVQNEGGVKALFRGNVAATYLWVGYAIVQFSLYNRVNKYLSSYDSRIPDFLPYSSDTSDKIPGASFGSKCSWARQPLRKWDDFRCELSKKPTTIAFISGATAGVWYVGVCV